MSKLTFILGITVLLISCKQEEIEHQDFKFDIQRGTGIDFANVLTENEEVNPLMYDNVYSGGGVGIGDINNDGLPDIYFGGNQVGDELYLNLGNLKFKKITKSAGILNKGGWSSGISMVDVNQDGFLDIYICKSLYDDSPELRTNELYINNGDETFTESAQSYGLDDPWRSQQAVFFDYDKDEDLDVFLVNQPPNPGVLSSLKGTDWRFPELSWRLLRNDGGHFNEVTKEAGVSHRGYGLSAVATDVNNDGWPDLYVSSDYNNPDFLYINQKDGTFKNTIRESLGHISYFSMGVDAADINNDGLSDLVVVDMVAQDNYGIKSNMSGMNPTAFWNTVRVGGHYQYMMNTLQLNQGKKKDINIFSEIGYLSGMAYSDWSWAPLLADFDNDGYKDLFISNGIFRELRNTDAISRVDQVVSKKLKAGMTNQDILKNADSLVNMFPQRKAKNHIYKNLNGLRFENKQENWGFGDGWWSTSAAYGDLDQDGDLDLVINNLNDTSFIYKNNANRTTNHFVRVKLLDGDKPVLGAKVEIKYLDREDKEVSQFSELGVVRGFYASVEPNIHFGVGRNTQIKELKVLWPDGSVTLQQNVEVDNLIEIEKSETTPEKREPQKRKLFEYDVAVAKHEENNYDDFEREILLPHKQSDAGPLLSISGDETPLVYIPGAMSFSGAAKDIFSQETQTLVNPSSKMEEVGSLFFDADNDGDDDLYVIAGGNELPPNDPAYQDKFFENVDGRFVERSNALPSFKASTLAVVEADYDGDSDLDLFIGGRLVPGQYPLSPGSRLLKNNFIESGSLQFEDVTDQIAKPLIDIGMVTDAVWADYDSDSDLDLIMVGEWMPITVLQNTDGNFVDASEALGLSEEKGWWFNVNAADFDNDGDVDFVLGNLGLNYKYKASPDKPFKLYSVDFDENGQTDIVLSYFEDDKEVPLRGKSCSSQQIPELKKRIKSYNQFANMSVTEVYGKQALNKARKFEAKNFESILLENDSGKLTVRSLPIESQIAPIRSTVLHDFNEDGLLDIVYAGNLYNAEIETPRADAGMGGVLINKGDMEFESLSATETGLYLNYDVRDLHLLTYKTGTYLLVGSNADSVRLLKVNKEFLF